MAGKRKQDEADEPLDDRKLLYTWVKVFRIIPEFRILRQTFHRKSASTC